MTSYLSNDLFPTKLSLIVFITYIACGVCHGIFITASQSSNSLYDYNISVVVLLVNITKLVASGGLFVKGYLAKDPLVSSLIAQQSTSPATKNSLLLTAEGVKLLYSEIVKNRRLLFHFFTPAAMYTAYDNLMFLSLSVFTPTTYNILAQARTVITAVVFERLFHRKLSAIQWFSLIFLTIGCILKEIYHFLNNKSQHSDEHATYAYFFALGCIGVQIVLSCFASVYTEYLFKDKDSRAHPMVENVFMYFNIIFCRLAVLLVRGHLWSVLTYSSISSVLRIPVVAIILNQALMGLVTATFLRKLNSILKSFATALELTVTPFMCWFLFGQKVDLCTVLALCVVVAASWVYANNPVRSDKTRFDLVLAPSSSSSNGTLKSKSSNAGIAQQYGSSSNGIIKHHESSSNGIGQHYETSSNGTFQSKSSTNGTIPSKGSTNGNGVFIFEARKEFDALTNVPL